MLTAVSILVDYDTATVVPSLLPQTLLLHQFFFLATPKSLPCTNLEMWVL